MVTLTKVCNRCKIVHDLSMYKKDKSKKDGLYTLCINCVKKYREDNKEKIKASKKLYRSKPENKEKERLQRIKYYNDNYFSCKQKRRDYVKKRKESGNPIVNKKVDYTRYKKNKERIKTYEMYRRLFCPEYKIKKNLRIRLNKALRKNFKNCSAVQSLGLTIQEFKDYLEALFYAEMNWDNYGSYWDVDHIIPLSSIDITNKEQVEKLCHYSNLQPLTKKHNYIKKDRILTKEENELLKLDLLKEKETP